MNEIQKVLIKAGRKDLAQEYYDKVSATEDKKINIDPKTITKLDTAIDKHLNKAIMDLEKFVKFKCDFKDDKTNNAAEGIAKQDIRELISDELWKASETIMKKVKKIKY